MVRGWYLRLCYQQQAGALPTEHFPLAAPQAVPSRSPPAWSALPLSCCQNPKHLLRLAQLLHPLHHCHAALPRPPRVFCNMHCQTGCGHVRSASAEAKAAIATLQDLMQMSHSVSCHCPAWKLRTVSEQSSSPRGPHACTFVCGSI